MSKLYIVGTPIGNLKDITYRAVETLHNVDYIFCEDTRTSSVLLKHYEIKTKTLSYHNFNEKEMAKKIVNLIQDGKEVAIISDAGMPVISDPGFEVIKQCEDSNIEVDVIGGPTALIHALIKSNFGASFTFLGFLKDKSQQRLNFFETLDYGVYVCYVSPHKLIATLEDFDKHYQNRAEIFLIKEMTKKYEKFYRGFASDIISELEDNIKGEFVLVFNYQKPKRVKVNKYAQN
ncbi:16S rRNA (cytidine(1402)-2'-O)-methyltransferase [[Mycoplasma] gypis]|uniref:Ribosomal RNA small subunit methyltransferase I n=1 Tax=[Mycoplasma] gypis TaxID=92404 RepID=A0ABZ2RT64_9BACT|nr:16S rRNA (cytidine(1402)-2'-O)-methyltransferase [[Mycoplasma] gypis]MBN0919561.1 16S rRNA (cytidine(1402)-2'-O)-methyltransferase [[Mycoplasma] gypis]